jgi:hypothetical protein
MRLIDIYNRMPDYVAWMEQNIHKRDVLDQIKAMKEYLISKEQNDEI